MLKNPLVATPHTSSAAVEAMLGMLPTCNGDGDGEVDPPKQRVLTIQREGIPLCEWNEMAPKHRDDGVLTIQREGIPLCEWNEMGPKHSDDGVLTIQREGIPLCEWNEMAPKHSDDGVLTIQHEGIPLCRWNKMGELLAGSHVTCFITGDAALKAGPLSS